MIRFGLVAVVIVASCKSHEWKPRPLGAYVVTAPRDPVDMNNKADAPTGEKVPIEMHVYTGEGNTTLQVQVAEVPLEVDPARALANMRNAIVPGGGKILAEKAADVGDVTGYDLTYTSDAPMLGHMQFRARFLFHDHHAYQVMSARPADDADAEELDADAKRFIESFAFTDDKPADPRTTFGVAMDAITIHPHADMRADGDGWFAAHSVKGKFTVRMPARYVDAVIDMAKSDQKGYSGVMDSVATDRDHVKFTALCVPAYGVPPDIRLSSFMKSVAKGGSSTNLQVGGHPAADAIAAQVRTRVIALDDRTCMLQVESLPAGTPPPEADTQKLFASFTPDEVHGEEAQPRR